MRTIGLPLAISILLATGQIAEAYSPSVNTAIRSTPPLTYYVDSVRGSDSNSGHSPEQAFKNLTALPTINTGQKIGLACGSYWRAPLPTSGTIGSYVQSAIAINDGGNNAVVGYPSGCPNRPIIDGSASLAGVSWTQQTTPNTNVYCSPTEYFYGGANGYQIFLWETGAAGDSATGQFMSYQTSIANVQANPGGYYIAGLTWGGTIPSSAAICIQPYDSSNPNTNGYAYDVSQQIPLTMFASKSSIQDVELRKSGSNTGPLNLNNNGGSYYLNNVLVRDGGKHLALVTSGTVVNNSTFIDCYYNVSSIGCGMLVEHDNSTSSVGQLPFSVLNSIFQQDQLVSGAGPNTCAQGHTDDATSMGNVYLTNDWCIAKNGTALAGYSFANVGPVTANYTYGSQLTQIFSLVQSWTFNNSQYYSTSSNQVPIIVQTAGPLTLNMTADKICAAAPAQGLIKSTAASITFNVTNSDFYLSTSAGSPYIIFNNAAGQAFNFNGNDMGSNIAWIAIGDQKSGGGNTFSGNNNIYEAANSPQFYLNATHYLTFLLWQAAVAPADSASTTSGGNAVAACTLPTIPTVQ